MNILSEYQGGVCGDALLRVTSTIVQYDDGGGNFDGATTISAGSWYYVVFVSDVSNAFIYVNGSLDATKEVDTDWRNACSLDVRIGTRASDVDPFDGNIDEVRVSNISRSSQWIQTEYNNQFSPSTFYSVGAEELQAAVVGKLECNNGSNWTSCNTFKFKDILEASKTTRHRRVA